MVSKAIDKIPNPVIRIHKLIKLLTSGWMVLLLFFTALITASAPFFIESLLPEKVSFTFFSIEFTSTGIPWELVYNEDWDDLVLAKQRELKIKKMKSRIYIQELIRKGKP
jgi:hypothetical protein